MKFGFPISLLLHSAALFGGLVMYSGKVKPFAETRIIPVEIISVSDITNIRASLKARKPEQIKEPDVPMTLETPMENAEDEGDSQKKVEEVEAEAELEKVAEITDPDAETIDVPDKPSEPEKPKEVDLDRLAGLINRVRDQAPEKNQQKTLQSETNQYVFADSSLAGSGEGTAMTLDETSALQSAMYKCWSIPAAAPNPELLIVPVKVKLFPDGYVETVTLGHFKQLNNFHKLAADAAIRAVNKCQPYDFLPAEKYSQWKDMTLNFRPDV